jgi:hypothetical protein
MAILIVNNLEQPQGLVLGERALIGRRPFNTIMVPDPAVSRIHAWIGRRDGRYVLYDAGSRSGTRLNDRTVGSSPRPLSDGDQIRIGPATILYMEADELPADVVEIEPAPVPPAADPYDGGIYFDCACGGPMWVPAALAGQMGKCRYCGERLVVPQRSGKMARHVAPNQPAAEVTSAASAAPAAAPAPLRRPPEMPVARTAPPRQARPAPPPVPAVVAPPPPPPPHIVAPPPPEAVVDSHVPSPAIADEAADADDQVAAPAAETHEAPCSICQTPIAPGEERTSCPSCHLTFHAGCWQENYGCSAYGCDQVNVLAPPDAQTPTGGAAAGADRAPDAAGATEGAMPAAAQSAVTVDMDGRPPFPWEPVLLALSFVATALGALAFGIPSGVMLLCVLAFFLVGRPRRRGLVVVALLVSVAGIAAGYATSMFWWKGQRVWEIFLK